MPAEPGQAEPVQAGSGAGDRRRWLTLVAMTGALSMILIDATVVSVALPTIQRDLDLTTTELQWVVNAYLLTLAALVAVGGRVSDTLGRVRVFEVGVVLFALASAGAGLSHVVGSSELLIAARALQGVGGAMMVPSSQAVVTNAFPLSERGTAMGIYAGISVGFMALGPLLGGFLTEHLGWEWVFFVNLPVAVLTVVLTVIARPDGSPVPAEGRYDWLGTVLLVGGLSAGVYGLQQSGAWGWSDPVIIGLLLGSLLLLGAFVAVELRSSSPLIELRIFRYGNFAVDSLVLFMVQFALMGMSVFGSIYAQDLLGFSPVVAGAALLPLTIPVLLVAPVSGRIYDRIGPRLPVSAGTALLVVGFAAVAVVLEDFEYLYLVPGYVALGIGVALIMTPANTDGMNTAPADLRGQASGVIQTMRQVGGTVGIALLTTIVVSVQTSTLNASLLDLGIDQTEATELEGLLAEAQSGGFSADDLPPQAADVPKASIDEVISAAKDAYASGIRVAFYVVAGLMAAVSLLAALRLRRVRFAESDDASPVRSSPPVSTPAP